MKRNHNVTKQVGGLLLEVLMIAFVFAHSWSDVAHIDKIPQGKYTISASPAEEPVFRDSFSSSETLLQFISKIQFACSETISTLIDVQGIEIATCESLLITQALYNTFYTNITINAP